jgi:hypothetical protein
LNLVFSSKLPIQCRPALENLLFFNSRQFRVRDGIIESLRQFGHPRLEETVDGVSVRVGELDTQTLFACDRDSNDSAPVGLVTFLRTSSTDMSILHIAVRSDYSLPGWRAGQGLGLVLIEKVKEIASRIVGVRRIVLQYRQGIVIQI